MPTTVASVPPRLSPSGFGGFPGTMQLLGRGQVMGEIPLDGSVRRPGDDHRKGKGRTGGIAFQVGLPLLPVLSVNGWR